ncbi:response regulator SirA [Candidatus Marsarchaeota G2 archaeon ECH_B_SAG-G16]|jgi:Predicted redox protein, regulator of disulfide bond formation|uniref:Response regulator SirA n=6 Tax=Candidatus Marsarchaeota TaxID=1978152 RepID=A0A2R6BYW5_9ARCH|nr:MAG: response regulator SirA [Candidatus Marsarchaeota G1 archaeon OSP_D]PSN85421.1 MAG: response regulator SirA [Candidatus Marsarchaeota G1 archaeon BE_D]PSN88175.1 MAG: response regulator SirA [Candidatus Marsarchaeota G1 archaeon OSP_C]PSN90405.1 MAG: response regulator SirA [Candidatus Marsarchaeota G1 archaeon OSP_B]PSO03797.1 MAG: response regulator SirA [Candidatus Marsarchaeota G2 archaeon ECH_B_SAG-G06]PSO04981.1 MAG: response regulator SirA [Candidatus Marsarchaeota G2 archaeon E
MSENKTPYKTLDLRGLLCPMPVIETNKAIKQIPVGEVLEVLATDPASKSDFASWSKRTGNEILLVKEEAGDPVVYRFLIKRKS